MRKLKAIALDFDGVILESVSAKIEAYLKLFRFPFHGESRTRRFLAKSVGTTREYRISYILTDIMKVNASDEEIQDLLERYSRSVVNDLLDVPFVKGAKEFLDEYRRKYKLYVVSSAPEKELRTVISKRLPGAYFAKVYGQSKLKAESLRMICKANKCKPKEIIFIGDSYSDMTASKMAGVPFVLRDGKSRNMPDEAVAVIKDLSLLPSALRLLETL